MQANYLARIETLRKRLENSEYNALIIANVQNCRYLSGLQNNDPNVAFLIIHPEKLYLITDYRYAQQAQEESPLFEVIIRNRDATTLGQQFQILLNTLKVKHLGFEQDHFLVGLWQSISSELTNITCDGFSGWIESQRMIKDDYEIQSIRNAAQIADTALNQLTGFMKPGMTERDASLELEYQMQKMGSEGLSFPTILISGERSALPHGMPNQKKLTHGDLITIDFGAVVNGYRSDMTRAFVVGQPSEKQLLVYNTVKKAQQAGLDAVRSGVRGNIPFQQSKAILSESEFSQYQGEGLGHGVGLYLHEQPFLNASCNIVLQNNMVITIEPGIYIPGWGGVRIEDDIVVTEMGFEKLTHSPNTLIVIE